MLEIIVDREARRNNLSRMAKQLLEREIAKDIQKRNMSMAELFKKYCGNDRLRNENIDTFFKVLKDSNAMPQIINASLPMPPPQPPSQVGDNSSAVDSRNNETPTNNTTIDASSSFSSQFGDFHAASPLVAPTQQLSLEDRETPSGGGGGGTPAVASVVDGLLEAARQTIELQRIQIVAVSRRARAAFMP